MLGGWRLEVRVRRHGDAQPAELMVVAQSGSTGTAWGALRARESRIRVGLKLHRYWPVMKEGR